MKRQTSLEKESFSKRSVKSWLKGISRASKGYNRYKTYSSSKGISKDSSKTQATGHLFAPEKLSIYGMGRKNEDIVYENTINFLNNFRRIEGQQKVIIDFSKTEHLTAPIVLMLYSILDLLPEGKKPKIQIIFSKTEHRVNSLLNASGFTSLCKGNRVKPDFSGEKPLSVVSGVGGKFRDEIVDFIQSRAYKNAMDAETEFVFGDAVQETINNVRLHAYPEMEDSDKKWWLLCEVIGQQLFLTIYDQGIGIPKTVTDREWFLQSFEQEYPNEYREILDDVTRMGMKEGILSSLKFYQVKKWTDPQLVYLSMLGDISGTKQRKHGQGSKSIKALVKETKQGKLWVYSNRGLYFLEDKLGVSDEDNKGEAIQLPKPLKGTLVQWNINIK
ncbi:hypothetical protein J7X65_001632 [Vibrio parahaemolyticus]|nr:hypothetical protein [Vibrio parahaemolyticus]EHH2490975.1 hypothetical protein [Vibrio parahaemolyticus]